MCGTPRTCSSGPSPHPAPFLPPSPEPLSPPACAVPMHAVGFRSCPPPLPRTPPVPSWPSGKCTLVRMLQRGMMWPWSLPACCGESGGPPSTPRQPASRSRRCKWLSSLNPPFPCLSLTRGLLSLPLRPPTSALRVSWDVSEGLGGLPQRGWCVHIH